jgi:predicted transcriptional regulator of viral defense system
MKAAKIAERVHDFAMRSRSYTPLDTILPTEGELNARWRLRLNVTAEELVGATRA